jgi:hypothetical protein
LTNLTSLNLSGCEQLSNLAALSALKKLTSLTLPRSKRLSHLEVLHTLPALQHLRLPSSWPHDRWNTSAIQEFQQRGGLVERYA